MHIFPLSHELPVGILVSSYPLKNMLVGELTTLKMSLNVKKCVSLMPSVPERRSTFTETCVLYKGGKDVEMYQVHKRLTIITIIFVQNYRKILKVHKPLCITVNRFKGI